MIYIVVRSFLGPGGTALLDLYLKYSLYINGIILLYVLLLVISRRNYLTISNLLIQDLNNKIPFNKDEQIQIRTMLGKIQIPWDDYIKATLFPFITPPKGWIFHLKTVQSLQRLYPPERLAEALIKEKQNLEKD
ncbi:MAG: hypothetical protein WCI88_14180 [Chloroflexota bacterium]|jgi:hypothetical protein